MPKKTDKPKPKIKRIPEAEIYVAAQKLEEGKKEAATAEKAWRGEQDTLVEQILTLRKTKSLTLTEFGPLTRITIVQNERMEYDEEAIFKELTPAQRREAFDFSLDISQLSVKDRKALNDAMIKLLTPAQRKAARKHRLNVDKLSAAVQSGAIDQKVIAEHAEVKKGSAYVTISHGSGS